MKKIIGSRSSFGLRTGFRAVRAISNPMMALRMAIQQVLMSLGVSFLMPLLSLAIPLIQAAVKAYIDAEIKRKKDEERANLYREAYRAISEEDRRVLSGLVSS